MTSLLEMARLNRLDQEQFTEVLRGIFEHSAWIPRRAHDKRPFASVADLHKAMVDVVEQATAAEQIALLIAHPQLAGKLAQAGELTAASTGEQSGVGLNALTPDELATVADLNAAYLGKFGFPFIIAVREHTRNSILTEWRRRLQNPAATERQAALEEVYKIARFRLDDTLGRTGARLTRGTGMGKLSTHVLDTALGKPAAGMRIDFSKRDNRGNYRLVKSLITNSDGRTDELLLDEAAMECGQYELMFYVGEYFGERQPDQRVPFLDQVPVRFAIDDASDSYHVPLLLSPWSYSTYRGS